MIFWKNTRRLKSRLHKQCPPPRTNEAPAIEIAATQTMSACYTNNVRLRGLMKPRRLKSRLHKQCPPPRTNEVL
ncbi:MAG: hypothetical protein EAZ33_17180 [Oscillatoriales cyanobacterium]|nr:MAG: hypothetical protein EAZ33_17180 [Oscillatoriales cyanobacterium]